MLRFGRLRACVSGDLQKSPSDFPDALFFALVFSKIDHLLTPENPGNILGIQHARIAGNNGYQTSAETLLGEGILNLPTHLPTRPLRTHRVWCQKYDHCLGLLQRVTYFLCPVISWQDLARGIPHLQARLLQGRGNLVGQPFIGMCVADEYLHFYLPTTWLDSDAWRAATCAGRPSGKRARSGFRIPHQPDSRQLPGQAAPGGAGGRGGRRRRAGGPARGGSRARPR